MVQVARIGGRGGGNLGNARKKSIFLMGGVPLSQVVCSDQQRPELLPEASVVEPISSLARFATICPINEDFLSGLWRNAGTQSLRHGFLPSGMP